MEENGVLAESTYSQLSDCSCPTNTNSTSDFTKSSLYNNQDLIDSIFVCYWDNIFGPRILHMWILTGDCNVSGSNAILMSKKAMSGELCRDLSNSAIDFKYFISDDHNSSVLSFIFSGTHISSLTLMCLLLIICPHQRKQYLMKHELILLWMKRIIPKLKIYLSKAHVEDALSEFTGDLRGFSEMLSSLHMNSLPVTIELKNTALNPEKTFDEKFLGKALASHICTMGRSLVVGKCVDEINTMLATLAMFNSPEERACSRFMDREKSYPYHQDLWLQGHLSGPENMLSFLTKEILCSQYPTTIVDLVNMEVVQSLGCPHHFIWRHHTRLGELKALYKDEEEKHTFPKGMFATYDYTDTYMQTCLSDMKLLSNSSLKESYVDHLKMALLRRAQAVIKYLEMETDVSLTWSRVSLRKLRQDLDLTVEGNFHMVMATAEKLKPGLYMFLLGENKNLSP